MVAASYSIIGWSDEKFVIVAANRPRFPVTNAEGDDVSLSSTSEALNVLSVPGSQLNPILKDKSPKSNLKAFPVAYLAETVNNRVTSSRRLNSERAEQVQGQKAALPENYRRVD
jgi:hypothetical protein